MKRHARSRKAKSTTRHISGWTGRALGLGRSQKSRTVRYEVAVPAMSRRVDRRLLPVRLISALLLVIMAWLLYWFSSDDMFYVSSLRVEGSDRLSASELLKASGLEGINIFWVDTQAAEQAIQALPDVASASVHCGMPADCVVLLVARSPVFVWRQGDAHVWVGDDGKVLPVRGELVDAIAIDAAGSRAVKPGDQLDLEVVMAVQELGRLKPDIRQYEYSDQHGLVFRNDRGWSVRIGTGAEIRTRLKVLEKLSEYLISQDVTPAFVDVRYPEAPFFGE